MAFGPTPNRSPMAVGLLTAVLGAILGASLLYVVAKALGVREGDAIWLCVLGAAASAAGPRALRSAPRTPPLV